MTNSLTILQLQKLNSMASTCCGVNYGETQTKTVVDKTSRSAKRMLGLRHLSFELTTDPAVAPLLDHKRRKVDAVDFDIQDIEIEKRKESPAETGPKFGMTSVCGRRRDMEDAVAIHPNFCRRNCNFPGDLHFYGVFDGHGCSHVSSAQLN